MVLPSSAKTDAEWQISIDWLFLGQGPFIQMLRNSPMVNAKDKNGRHVFPITTSKESVIPVSYLQCLAILKLTWRKRKTWLWSPSDSNFRKYIIAHCNCVTINACRLTSCWQIVKWQALWNLYMQNGASIISKYMKPVIHLCDLVDIRVYHIFGIKPAFTVNSLAPGRT